MGCVGRGIEKGYVFDEEAEEYICLACGEAFIKGVIYQDNQVLYEAEVCTIACAKRAYVYV